MQQMNAGDCAQECDQFVTDGHFPKFQSLKACEK